MRRPSPTRATIRRSCVAAGIIAGAGGVSAVFAQNQTGPVITGTISQQFEADSNLRLDDETEGTSYFAETRLGLGYLSETGTQVFALGLDTGVRALWEAGEDFEFVAASPSTAQISYGREWSDSSFETYATYRQRQVDFDRVFVDFDPDSGLPDTIERVSGNAIERRYDGGFDIQLATDAPSSYYLTFDATHFDYSEDTDNRVPRTSYIGELGWELEVTPLLSTAVLGSYYFYTADDEEETEITVAEFDAGVIYHPSDNLRLGFGIGYADRHREETIGGNRVTTEDEQGPTARATVNYAFEDFTIVGTGRITAAAPETRGSGDLRVIYPLPNGRINARVFQRYTGDSDGDEVRVTGAGFGLLHDINSVSSLSVDFAVARQENQDDPAQADIDRFDATAVYTYEFTEVVSADVGYRFRSRKQDPADAQSNAVFFQIGRTFETLP